MVHFLFSTLILLAITINSSLASSDLDLVDSSDIDVLLDENEKIESKNFNKDSTFGDSDTTQFSQEQESGADDLSSLKEDIGEVIFPDKDGSKSDASTKLEEKVTEVKVDNGTVVNIEQANQDFQMSGGAAIFDTGKEESDLLTVCKYLDKKIPANEWSEIAQATKMDKYVVAEGEWLWKISQNLFGSGFYYAKIWALNPYITNPHEIEPGMTLVFNTGDEDNLPKVALGSFGKNNDTLPASDKKSVTSDTGDVKDVIKSLSNWGGDDVTPPWLNEKKKLLEDGGYVQYSSTETYDDLIRASSSSLIKEYESYDPPVEKFLVTEADKKEYGTAGFSKASKVAVRFKEGFFLNTFVTKNPVQDLGLIDSAINEGMVIFSKDKIYVKFDSSLKIGQGDLFSVYTSGGEISHSSSDRKGYKYTIIGKIVAQRPVRDLWECEVVESTGVIHRKDRITIYTPKIDRILTTFNPRVIEASIIQGFEPSKKILGYGDVVYLDRGRADGVESGNVFEVFAYKDKGTDKKITGHPTYKSGEITVIAVTDNFSTGLLSNSKYTISLGDVTVTKSPEEAARTTRLKDGSAIRSAQRLGKEMYEELDSELKLDDLNDSLLDRADSVKLTDDEIEELERQERQRSTLKDGERDLKALEKLEKEIEGAEKIINEAKLDEDKLLEDQNLNNIEKKAGVETQTTLGDINDLEGKHGKKFLDENLNSKENPYGLTNNDLEEVDELMNTEGEKK